MRIAYGIIAVVSGLLFLTLAAGLGFLQTGAGKTWLASTVSRAASTPSSRVAVGAISGFVPFDVTIDQVRLSDGDGDGAWLVMDRLALTWSPTALLRGRLKVDRIAADRIELSRQPPPSSSQPSSSGGFVLPHLPVAVEVDELSVGRLSLGAAAGGGEDAAAALTAHGLLARGRAELVVRLTRVDNQPGSAALKARYEQAADVLDLDLDVDEPTGILLDAALGRSDKLPLRVTLKGGGPLDGWKGRLVVSARDVIHADTAIEFAHAVGSRIALSGAIKIASLLPENARAIAGNEIKFDIVAAASGRNAAMLAPSRLEFGGATVTAEGAVTEDGGLSGKLTLALPDMSTLEPLIGSPARGALSLDAVLSGSREHPDLALTEHGRVAVGQIAIDGLSLAAHVAADTRPGPGDPRFTLKAGGKVNDIRDAAEDGQDYGPLDLSFAGTTDAKGSLVDVQAFSASGVGIALDGQGNFRDGAAKGKATLKAADLSVVGKLLGQTLHGSANADLIVSGDASRSVALEVKATGERLETGIAAVDALSAGTVNLDAAGTRSADGRITLSRLALSSLRAKLEGDGAFNEADRALSANLKATLNDLSALSATVSSPLGGTGVVSAKVWGRLDAPSIEADAALDRLVLGTVRIDHVDARLHAPQGLNAAATLSLQVASGRLNEAVDAGIRRLGNQAYRLERFHMAGTGGTADGALGIDLAANRVSGKLDATIGDLSIWSNVVGQPMTGRVGLSVSLPEAAARQGPVKATVDRLSLGAGPEAVTVAHASLDGAVSGDFSRPAGAVDLSLGDIKAGGASLTTAGLHIAATGNKADFRARGAGRTASPLTFDLAGTVARERASTNLRLTSLGLMFGADRLALTRPVSATIAPGLYQVSGLGLTIDGGALEGDALLSRTSVSANLHLRQFPLHPVALFAGEHAVGGTLNGSLTLAGTPGRPEAHAALTTEGLDIETDGPLPRPSLSLTANIDWRGDRADLDVRVGTGSGEKLALTGSAPFAFDLPAFAMRQPANPNLSLRLTGGGKIENLASILPLGEDRMSGAFAVDIAVGGTMAAPSPSGRVAVTGGRYANMALGTELDGIDIQISGAGQRFVLDHLAATDGKSGKLDASGSVDLGVSPAQVGLDLGFTDFLVARSDDATIDADGALKLAGTFKDAKLSGRVGVRRAELYIPDRLPPNIVKLDVVEIGGKQGAQAPQSEPLAPVGLAIALDAPGQIFVRGHGVTSEWRGHVDISGNSSGPVMTGQLTVVNGSISLLGQSFSIDRGTVNFLGGHMVDPALDVQASATASSVTAQVNVTGTATQPKITLSSIPALPRDEILARVLFGQNVGSLTPSQGIQLAAAAAQLAQGGPGILDRVRSSIGLDRLDFGGGSSNGSQGASSGTTVTGGKYIANGVFVGVGQGLSTNSSQAKVEVEITPNISVNSTFGTATGSGFGAKYSVDY